MWFRIFGAKILLTSNILKIFYCFFFPFPFPAFPRNDSFGFPFPKFGYGFFHSLPVPEFWECFFSFPSRSQTLGMEFSIPVPVPEPSKVIPAHPWFHQI